MTHHPRSRHNTHYTATQCMSDSIINTLLAFLDIMRYGQGRLFGLGYKPLWCSWRRILSPKAHRTALLIPCGDDSLGCQNAFPCSPLLQVPHHHPPVDHHLIRVPHLWRPNHLRCPWPSPMNVRELEHEECVLIVQHLQMTDTTFHPLSDLPLTPILPRKNRHAVGCA